MLEEDGMLLRGAPTEVLETCAVQYKHETSTDKLTGQWSGGNDGDFARRHGKSCILRTRQSYCEGTSELTHNMRISARFASSDIAERIICGAKLLIH